MSGGQHIFVCWFEDAEGWPHVERGMITPFRVDGEPVDAEPPGGADGTFQLDEYDIELPESFDGRGSFAVKNSGDLDHEVAVLRVPEGTKEEDVLGLLEDHCQTVDCTNEGGVMSLRFRKSATAALDLGPGRYVFACCVPDPSADGTQHYRRGIWRIEDIG